MHGVPCGDAVGTVWLELPRTHVRLSRKGGVVFDCGGPWCPVRRMDGTFWGGTSLEQWLEHGLLSVVAHDSATHQGAVTYHLLLFYAVSLQGGY